MQWVSGGFVGPVGVWGGLLVQWMSGGFVGAVGVWSSAGSIPGFVRYRSIPEFCSILDTYVVSLKSI